jgi:hypothetical protein
MNKLIFFTAHCLSYFVSMMLYGQHLPNKGTILPDIFLMEVAYILVCISSLIEHFVVGYYCCGGIFYAVVGYLCC